MLEEKGVIVKTEGDYLWVEAISDSGCGHCSARQGCGTASLQKWFNRKPNHLRLLNTSGYQTGDTVIIGIPDHALLKGSFAIYMLPLLALLIGALVGIVINDWLGWGSREPVSIISGFVSFAGSFIWLRRYTLKYAQKAEYLPVILRTSY